MTIALVINGETVGEYAFADVSLEGDDISTITDTQVKARVARYRDELETQYDDYVVDRFTGETDERNFVIRKRAVYGEEPNDDLADRLEEILGGSDDPDEEVMGALVVSALIVKLSNSVHVLTHHLQELEVRVAWLEGAAGKK